VRPNEYTKLAKESFERLLAGMGTVPKVLLTILGLCLLALCVRQPEGTALAIVMLGGTFGALFLWARKTKIE